MSTYKNLTACGTGMKQTEALMYQIFQTLTII